VWQQCGILQTPLVSRSKGPIVEQRTTNIRRKNAAYKIYKTFGYVVVVVVVVVTVVAAVLLVMCLWVGVYGAKSIMAISNTDACTLRHSGYIRFFFIFLSSHDPKFVRKYLYIYIFFFNFPSSAQ
jgi:hypothetical protein